MDSRIYDKTDKGRDEIATRKYHLPSKLRTLLVVIDGRHSLGSLLTNLAVLGLSEEQVAQLLRDDYITLVSGAPADDAPQPPALPVARPASSRARMLARTRGQAARPAHAAEDEEVEAPAAAPPDDSAERFRALYDFYNQTIKSSIGLRGVVLQLKVEKAASIDDFHLLRLPYLQAVLKAKGRATALGLRERLDALFGATPEPDPFELPDEDAPAARGVLDYFNLANDSVNF